MSTTISARGVLRAIVLTAILASAALLGGPSESRAQATATPPEVLAALLVEVRGLRAAMEQMASAGPRVQLALGRLQLQEQRVNTLLRRLEDVRTSLVQAQKGLEDATHQLSEREGTVREARESPDPEVRRELEASLKRVKTEMARMTLDVQRLQNEEATLSQDLAAEQGRWTELNQRLEELERSLGRR